MFRRFLSWVVRRRARRSERDIRRFSESLRTRTVRVFTCPIRTTLSTAFTVAIAAVLYLVSRRPAETTALLDADAVTTSQVLALFPPIYVLAPALVALVVLVNVVRVWSGVRSDMGWNRYDQRR
ncbi:hypothetical protein [Halorubellus sp. PRR65]|uniref:hypothetical protein n=1 Tax=Halorubellus sp. PRR65 TaxID=3098148 RepID=UPI002B257353|nr:hypothetical protein [Halorubellus sp. PRR65]